MLTNKELPSLVVDGFLSTIAEVESSDVFVDWLLKMLLDGDAGLFKWANIFDEAPVSREAGPKRGLVRVVPNKFTIGFSATLDVVACCCGVPPKRGFVVEVPNEFVVDSSAMADAVAGCWEVPPKRDLEELSNRIFVGLEVASVGADSWEAFPKRGFAEELPKKFLGVFSTAWADVLARVNGLERGIDC